MGNSTDPLVVGRVIGDVVDMFMPSMDMAVYYGSRQTINGCKIKSSATVDRPNVQIAGRHFDASLYTLVPIFVRLGAPQMTPHQSNLTKSK